jgi:hypothetical protein
VVRIGKITCFDRNFIQIGISMGADSGNQDSVNPGYLHFYQNHSIMVTEWKELFVD